MQRLICFLYHHHSRAVTSLDLTI